MSSKLSKAHPHRLNRELDASLEVVILFRLKLGEVSGETIAEIIPEFKLDNRVRHKRFRRTLDRLIEERQVARVKFADEDGHERTVYRLREKVERPEQV